MFFSLPFSSHLKFLASSMLYSLQSPLLLLLSILCFTFFLLWHFFLLIVSPPLVYNFLSTFLAVFSLIQVQFHTLFSFLHAVFVLVFVFPFPQSCH